MLHLAVSAPGEEYFELMINKEEPGAVLSNKNLSGGLGGSEDHADGKIFSSPGSKRCSVQTIKAYIFHLNPEVDALFQRPKDICVRFSPEKDSVWFERKVLGHNTVKIVLKNMTLRAAIKPHCRNHSLRATTVTVLSTVNVETQQSKAATGYKTYASIKSYCGKPTLHQLEHMSSALTSFNGKENTAPTTTGPLQLQNQPKVGLPQALQLKSPLHQDQPASPPFKTTKTSIIISNGVNQNSCDSTYGCLIHGYSFTFNINTHK